MCHTVADGCSAEIVGLGCIDRMRIRAVGHSKWGDVQVPVFP